MQATGHERERASAVQSPTLTAEARVLPAGESLSAFRGAKPKPTPFARLRTVNRACNYLGLILQPSSRAMANDLQLPGLMGCQGLKWLLLEWTRPGGRKPRPSTPGQLLGPAQLGGHSFTGRRRGRKWGFKRRSFVFS